jgi:uncharacterized protein YjbI with pentapeptide repeats
MELYEIKNRFSGSVIYSLECNSVKICAETAVRSKTNLSDADLSGADLSGVNFSGAYLSDAHFRGAYFRDADGNKIIIKKTPIQISGLKWAIIIFDSHIKIGCEFHSIANWNSFDDGAISAMHRGALPWWKNNKEFILNLCEANGRG